MKMKPLNDETCSICKSNMRAVDALGPKGKCLRCHAAEEIWDMLCDWRGFGLAKIEDEDSETYNDIIREISSAIQRWG